MKTILFILNLFFFSQSFAVTLLIHGQEVEVTRVAGDIQTAIIGAVIANPVSIQLPENAFTDIPAGSSLYFQKNQGQNDNLKLNGLVINAPMANQSWKLRNGNSVVLNCGRFASSPSFIKLTNEFDLLSGCKSPLPQQLGDLILNKDSNLDFFSSGKLKGSSKTSGTIELNNQTVKLQQTMGLRYHDNGNLFYFHPLLGEEFSLSTELNKETLFYQPVDQNNFAVMFHENGMLSTAILKEPETEVTVNLFGTDVSFFVASGPVGFNELGIIDRLALKSPLKLIVSETTYLRSTEINFQVASHGVAKPGVQITIKAGEQLFLNSTEEIKTLRGFTEQGLGGLAFFNEVSSTPFTVQ